MTQQSDHEREAQSQMDLRRSETISEALARIRADSKSETDKGTWFELLTIQFLKQDPTFEVDGVWRWRDWPEREALTGLDGRDMGIDLVARLRNKAWVAVQCKFYAEDRRISRKDIYSFITESECEPFVQRWMIVTCPWGEGAERALARKLTIPVRRIDLRDYADRPVLEVRKPKDRWILDGKRLEAVDAVIDGLETQGHDRGKLIMACGTGKTFVSLKASERLAPDDGRVLFAAPSIALVSQARKEWLTHTERMMTSLVVCSDSTAGGRGESDKAGLDDLVCPVASNPPEIADHLRGGKGVKAVFCTYQSLDKVIEAQRDFGGPEFDLAIADEAHRTVGVEAEQEKAFQNFHRPALRIRKRLYMTATPRIYSPRSKERLIDRQKGLQIYDMDDPAIYGRQLYRLKFKDAVAAGMLSDYRVIVLGVRSEWITDSLTQLVTKTPKIKPSDAIRLLGVSLAVNGHIQGEAYDIPQGPLGRTLAFANSIARSKWYAATINDPDLRSRTTRRIRMDAGEDAQAAVKVVAEHLDGSHSALKRNQGLRNLREGAVKRNECRMVCNAKLFSEGIDVPQLDAVVFLDPRQSHIDILQAVGRVMRRSEGKRFGYIVIPIALKEGESVNDALAEDRDGFKAVGDVLRALQSHDERLADDIARFVKVVDPPAPMPPPIPTDKVGEPQDGYGDAPDEQISLLLSAADAGVYARVSAAFGLSGTERGKVTADQLESAVRAAAAILERDECEEALSDALQLRGIPGDNLRKIAALLLCNALLMHKRLLGAIDIPGVEKLDQIMRMASPANALIPSWEQVLRRDYAPVFAPALAVLLSLRDGPNANEAVSLLATCAEAVAESLSDMGYDHAGPLYHRILPSAESDGAFYTHNISAVLLARLALDEHMVDWSDFESACELRIIDPACGTGTLLMAAMKTIKDRATKGGAFTNDNIETAHKRLVESSLRGLDINWHALQLAASNLTLGAPTVDYEVMHFHAMKHGVDETGASAGSLELIPDLIASRKPDLLSASRTMELARDFVGARQVAGGEGPDLRNMDVVLMNPPFTINIKGSAKFGQEGKRVMEKQQDKILDVINRHDPATAAAISRMTIQTFFTPLADCLLHPDKGVLATVLPFAACVNLEGAAQRRFLSDRFEVSVVVTSHAKQLNFSASTSIHECLVVCRRKIKRKRDGTLFVALTRMPATAGEAIKVTDAISEGTLEGEWGRAFRWPRERVEAGDWSACQWVDGDLAETAHNLSRQPALRPLGELVDFGSSRQVRSAMRSPLEDLSSGPYRVMWRHQTGVRRTMRDECEFSVAAKPGKKREAQRANAEASRLLIANKLNTNATRVTALFLDAPASGSFWTPVSPKRLSQGGGLAVQQAWCAWLNSTPGILVFMHNRSRKLTYSDFGPNKLKSFPVPDPVKADLAPLNAAYNFLAGQELLPWPRMDECSVRAALDEAAADAVGLDRDEVSDWRRRLAQEPTIRGHGKD